MNDKLTIRNYLTLAGVNHNVITFLENKTGIYLSIIEFLGDDFIKGMDINANGCVEKLKKGNDNFRILESGNVWYSDTPTPKIPPSKNSFYRGNIFLEENDKYKSFIRKSYISVEDNAIVVRKIAEKQKEENHFDGEIVEERYSLSLNRKQRIVSYWFDSETRGIPNNDLTIQIENFNDFGFAERKNAVGNYCTASWNFVYFGRAIEKQKTLNSKRSLKEKLKSMKNILVTKKEIHNPEETRNI